MTPSTSPSSAAVQPSVNAVAVDLCALVCARSAGLHTVLVALPTRDSVARAVAFAAVVAALAASAVT